MNCKPRDLAIVANSRHTPKNIGKIVRCVRLIYEGETIDGFSWSKTAAGPTWLVEGEGLQWMGQIFGRRPYADSCLRPIRPQPDDAVDEVIQRIGTPYKEPA